MGGNKDEFVANIINYLKTALNSIEALIGISYDETQTVVQDNAVVEYGIVHGNNLIVFIKVGMHGSIYGYQNKYLEMAELLNKRYGCTVITVSNPKFIYSLESEMKFVRDYAKKSNFNEYELFYMGHSFGGTLGLLYGYKYSEIKRILAVNSPFSDDTDEMIKGINSFKGLSLDLVYGLEDDFIDTGKKYSYLKNQKVHFSFLEDVDHYFTDKINQFILLPVNYFFENINNNIIDNSEENNMNENIEEPDGSLNEQLPENPVYKPSLKALYHCERK